MSDFWSSTAYEAYLEALKGTLGDEAINIYTLWSGVHFIGGEDVDRVSDIVILQPLYWKGDVLNKTPLDGSHRIARLTEEQFQAVVTLGFSSLRVRISQFELADEHFTRVRTGSPGNPSAFVDIVPQLAGYDAPATAVILVSPMEAGCSVCVAYSTGEYHLGAAVFTDDSSFPLLAALLCMIGAREVLAVHNLDLYHCIEAQGLMYTIATEGIRRAVESELKSLEGTLTHASLEKIRNVLITDARTTLDALYHKSLAACYSSREVSHLIKAESREISGGCILLGLLRMVMDTCHVSSTQSTVLFESPSLDSCLLYTPSDMLALNILATNSAVSLHTLLYKTATPYGAGLLTRWLRAPLIDLIDIQERQELVHYLAGMDFAGQRYTHLHKLLKRSPNLETIGARLRDFSTRQKGTLFPGILDMYVFFRSYLPGIVSTFTDSTDALESVHNLSKSLQLVSMALAGFQEQVEAVFDLNSPYLSSGASDIFASNDEIYLIVGFDQTLDELRQRLDLERTTITREYGMINESVKGARILFTPSQGYVIRCPKSSYPSVMALGSAIILENKANYVKFTTECLQKSSERRKEAFHAYFKHQATLEASVLSSFVSYEPSIARLAKLLATIDVLSSFATQATNGWTRPTLTCDGPLHLQHCKNPLLMNNIGIDATIGSDIYFDDKRRVLLLTGPNAGGKTTLLRALGQSIVLAQIGALVPCAAATIPIRTRLAVRLGTSDCLRRGYSTFMYEMVNTQYLLSTAQPGALLLIDELGRGTSVSEGYGISRAVIEEILGKRCMALVATHIMELVAGLTKTAGLWPVHMRSAFAGNKLVLTYNLADGSATSTYGLDVARAAGMPREVIDMATATLAQEPSRKFQAQTPTKDLTDSLVYVARALLRYSRGAITADELRRIRDEGVACMDAAKPRM
ncbi:Msh2-like protein [Giardia muris]|uniref:Msh2-like protein n=1 Tax=Giardia muris TaxID=5742 RepID=A0A4Z1SSJ8_GIAMU|nr:Msh2-like protein [Giardia muris]|eukprot:TNJ28896.1 Msh2-like protein [Giardia muris]